jgi:hypothetical protein
MTMREERFSTPGTVRLHVENPAGCVEIVTHDDPETTIELSMSRGGDDEAVLDEARVESVARDGGHDVYVEISGHRGGLGSLLRWLVSTGGVNVVVHAPHGLDLDAKTASADVTTRGRVQDASVSTASGAVRLDDTTGEVRVRTASGSVECQTLPRESSIASASGSVRVGHVQEGAEVKTASGRIEIDETHGHLEARSASGSVEIGTAEGDLRAETASGRVRIARMISGHAELRTVSGSVVAGVAQGTALHVEAEAVSGSLDSEIDLDEEPAAASSDGPQLSLRIRSVSGSVRIVRSAARSAA